MLRIGSAIPVRLAFGHLGADSLSIDAQYDEAYLFLEEVRNQFSRPIPEDRIFLVPGNHDIKRSEILSSQTGHLDGLAAGDYEQSQ